jgi:hypothetical protein
MLCAFVLMLLLSLSSKNVAFCCTNKLSATWQNTVLHSTQLVCYATLPLLARET